MKKKNGLIPEKVSMEIKQNYPGVNSNVFENRLKIQTSNGFYFNTGKQQQKTSCMRRMNFVHCTIQYICIFSTRSLQICGFIHNVLPTTD